MNAPGVQKPLQRTVLVTGATGFIGSALVQYAAEQGHRVKTFSRSIEGISNTISAEDRFVGTLPACVPSNLFNEVHVVVHCAVWLGNDAQQAHAVNVEGTLRLAQLARAAGVETFIFLSSQSAHAKAASVYGRAKHSAEQALLALGGINIIVIRPGLVCGPGSKGLFQRLSGMVDVCPVLPLPDGGRAIVQPLHVKDLCDAILKSVTMGSELKKRVICLGDPSGVSLATFVQALAVARSGKRKYVVPLPMTPLKACVEFAERFGIRLPISADNLKGLEAIEWMDTEADMKLLGIPVRPLEEIVSEASSANDIWQREALVLAQYLIGTKPSSELLDRYAAAMSMLNITLEGDEKRLWQIAIRYPFTLRFIDGGLALTRPHSAIRRKIYTMLAIIEASPDFVQHFLPRHFSLVQAFSIILVAFRAIFAAAVGVVFVKVIAPSCK